MLYDIPGRTATPIETETLVRLAEHDKIVAVKDAKGDLEATSWVLRRTDLAYYSGDDKMTLPLLSVGAVGVVGVPTHLFGAETGSMIAAYLRGDVAGALAAHRQLLAGVHRLLPHAGRHPDEGGTSAGRPARWPGAAAARRRDR